MSVGFPDSFYEFVAIDPRGHEIGEDEVRVLVHQYERLGPISCGDDLMAGAAEDLLIEAECLGVVVKDQNLRHK